MSSSAELFEKIAHPTRIRVLEILESTPMSFGKLKNELGISSSGNLDYHLKKLEGLIILDPEGNYRLSDEGKEALVAVRIIETSAAARDQTGGGMYKHRPSRKRLLVFFVYEFVVVIVALTLLQLAGLDPYAPEIAGFIGGASAIIGSLLFLRPSQPKPST